jgi:hypothetical protein
VRQKLTVVLRNCKIPMHRLPPYHLAADDRSGELLLTKLHAQRHALLG